MAGLGNVEPRGCRRIGEALVKSIEISVAIEAMFHWSLVRVIIPDMDHGEPIGGCIAPHASLIDDDMSQDHFAVVPFEMDADALGHITRVQFNIAADPCEVRFISTLEQVNAFIKRVQHFKVRSFHPLHITLHPQSGQWLAVPVYHAAANPTAVETEFSVLPAALDDDRVSLETRPRPDDSIRFHHQTDRDRQAERLGDLVHAITQLQRPSAACLQGRDPLGQFRMPVIDL
jgi:hypothetical protein